MYTSIENVINQIPGFEGEHDMKDELFGIRVAEGTRIEARFECELDGEIPVNNPVIRVSTKYSFDEKYRSLGCSKILSSAPILKFQKPFGVFYRYGVKQTLKIEVIDIFPTNVKNFSNKFTSRDRILGSSIISFNKIWSSICSKKPIDQIPITQGKKKKKINRGKINISVSTTTEKKDQKKEQQQDLLLSVSASKLPKMDIIGKGDPYFILFVEGVGRDGSVKFTPIYTSEVIMNTDSPKWKDVFIPINSLEKYKNSIEEEEEEEEEEMKKLEEEEEEEEEEGEEESMIGLRIECYDWDKNSSNDFIGSKDFILSDLTTINQPIINFELKKKKKNRGIITFQRKKLLMDSRPDFYDLLVLNKIRLSVSIAIDFSLSHNNKKQRLHQTQIYKQCISSICKVLGVFENNTKFISVFGTGAIFNQNKIIKDCFPLLLKKPEEEEEKEEVDISPFIITGNKNDVLNGYKYTFEKIEQSKKPAKLSPIIESMILQSNNNNEYSILFILLGGDCGDLKQTIDSIISSSRSPLSIILIALGGGVPSFGSSSSSSSNSNQSFKGLSKLFRSQGGSRTLKHAAVRNNLNLVDNNLENKFVEGSWDGFVAEAVSEIPKQVEDWFSLKGGIQ